MVRTKEIIGLEQMKKGVRGRGKLNILKFYEVSNMDQLRAIIIELLIV